MVQILVVSLGGVACEKAAADKHKKQRISNECFIISSLNLMAKIEIFLFGLLPAALTLLVVSMLCWNWRGNWMDLYIRLYRQVITHAGASC